MGEPAGETWDLQGGPTWTEMLREPVRWCPPGGAPVPTSVKQAGGAALHRIAGDCDRLENTGFWALKVDFTSCSSQFYFFFAANLVSFADSFCLQVSSTQQP